MQDKSPIQGLFLIAIIGLLILSYINYHSLIILDSSVSNLTSKHYELSGKVSGIQIKSDDTANQLMLSLENQYWLEIADAVRISDEAGFDSYHKMVLINPDLHVVRLMNLDGDEISVNYLTKVITTHSVDY